jgi:hypothetical protein
MVRRKRLPLVVAGVAALAAAATVAIQANAATRVTSASLRPSYGPVSVETAGTTYKYRSMPALQYITWTNSTGTHKRFIRSFQITRDDGTLNTVIQYHTGGSMTDRTHWKEALDTSGRRLLSTTPYAKVNNTFKSGNATVTMDEMARKDSAGRFIARRSSSDGGVHWSNSRAPLDMAGGAIHPCARGRAFQRVIRLPDNTLVMPFYAVHKANATRCADITRTWSAAHLLISRDEGKHWRRASTVFKSTTNTYSESTVARRSDHKLIMISRYDVVSGNKQYAKLAYRVTKAPVDNAYGLLHASWGPWTAVKVPGAADYPNTAQGSAPVLHQMDGGKLMLVFGRPRNKVAFSSNGGASWSTAHSFYDNIPTSGCSSGYRLSDGTYFPCSSLGSSGYMGVAVTSPRTAYVIGDNCHTNWGCAGNYSYPHGTTYRLWYSTIRLS